MKIRVYSIVYDTMSNNITEDCMHLPKELMFEVPAGFNVIDDLLIRAEYRLDWGNQSNGTPISSPDAFGPSGGLGGPVLYEPTGSGPSHYAGVEVVYSF